MPHKHDVVLTYGYACACIKLLLAVYYVHDHQQQVFVVVEECPTSVGEFSFELIIRCLRRANVLIMSNAIQIIFGFSSAGGSISLMIYS